MSLRLTLLNASLRTLARPFLKRAKSPERARSDFELAAKLFFRGPRKRAVRTTLGNISALELDPGRAPEAPVLLFFHGGGYIAGSAKSHAPMIGHLCKAAGLRAILPDYRLAPEHPFPAAFEDAVAIWRHLRESGVSADRIVLGGDSAGGGLALALLAWVLGEGERPAALVAFSPWTDLTRASPSLTENAARDAILPVERMDELCAMVVGGGDPADPRVSPVFADFSGAPPVYFQASETEILRDDTKRMVEAMRQAGVDVTADYWEDAPHVWQLFVRWIPEADEALSRTASFLKAQI